MKKLIVRFVSAVAVVAMASTSWAAQVTPEQAQAAVGNWIRLGSKRMDSEFRSGNAANTKTVRSKTGRAVFHAVNLEGGGFVVTSGDTRLSPIIAFSASGRYSDDGSGPLHALLQRKLSPAVSALERSDHKAAAASGSAKSGEDPHAAAMAEWAELLPEKTSDGGKSQMAKTGGSRKTSLSDVRVDKLLKTGWGQGGFSTWKWDSSKDDWVESNYPAFNYYTPSNYPCGCVATAGGQIMKYWEMPKDSIAQFSNTCEVDGRSVTRKSIAGAFDWANMFLKWDYDDPVPSATQRKAVGMLTYNLAVALGMEWGPGYGSSSPTVLVDILKTRFGYKSGTFVWHDMDALDKPGAVKLDDFNQRRADFENALFASLDAKMPVVVSISGDYGGHAIVADGYGYTSGKRYTHLNFGWYGGDDDVWYRLVDEMLLVSDDEDVYSEVSGAGFNIHPTTAGDVISGRVLNSAGAPVSSATVKLYDASNNVKASTTPDAKGIYSFRVTVAGKYTVKASATATTETPSKAVSMASLSRGGSFSTDKTSSWAGWTGNKWGVDLKFSTTLVSYTVTFNANGGDGGTTRSVGEGAALGTLPTPTRSGYTFDGWWTAASGGTQISSSTTVTKAVTYYAHWKPVVYTVTFNANGGSLESASATRKVENGSKVGDLPKPTRSGYSCIGWFTAASGGTKISKDTVISGNVTYYAHWDTATYALTLKPNNTKYGTVSGGGKFHEGEDATIQAKAKKGYVFGGWFTDKSCKTQFSPDDGTYLNPKGTVNMVDEDLTLYAKFITKAADKKALSLSKLKKSLSVTSGASLTLPTTYSAASLATLTLKGLPKGVVQLGSAAIEGTPTKPGTYTVTATLKSAGGNTLTQKIKITVKTPSWATGTFYGRALPSTKESDPSAYLQFTVGSTGKVSGKITYKGKAYSFTSSISSCVDDDADFKPKVKVGSSTFQPGLVTITQHEQQDGLVLSECMDANDRFVAQKKANLVKKGKKLAALVGKSFTFTKADEYSGLTKAKDKIKVLLSDGDSVKVTGTVNGKKISLSAPLTVESVNTGEQMGRSDLSLGYVLYAHILDAKAKYYRTFILGVDLGLDGSLVEIDAVLQDLVK